MKNKKIITGFLVIILMFIFNINVNAQTYTHSYINPNRTIDNVNAATYCFYNMYVPPGEYSYYESGVQKSFDSHIKILTFQDFGEYTEYSQVLVYFDESTLTKVKYNDYYYIFFKKYRYTFKKYRQNNITKEMETLSGLTGNTLTGSTSFTYKRFGLKLKDDYSSFSYNQDLSTLINNADDLAINGFSSSSWCYSNFYEVTSTINLLGDVFVNDADIQNPRYYGITLVDKQGFIDWIIENQKYMVFADYGITTATQYVDDIIDLYEEFNTSPLKFYTSIPGFLISNGSIFSSVDKAKQLFNLLDSLYQEFKLSQQQKVFEVGTNNNLLPHQRVDPNTDNPIYIEDINDTLDIKLLREILKTLIQTPNIIYDLFDFYLFNISSNVSLIADYIVQIPTYMTDLMYYRFLPLFDSIGGDSIENITNYNIQNLYTLNDEDNPLLNLEVNINNKFPIINQTNNLVNIDDYIVDSSTAPVFTMKKPTISNDMKFISTEEEIVFADFNELSTYSTIVKSIISVFFLFYFIKWIQNYIPKLLAGYNETD